jgi:hypothetical protein
MNTDELSAAEPQPQGFRVRRLVAVERAERPAFLRAAERGARCSIHGKFPFDLDFVPA